MEPNVTTPEKTTNKVQSNGQEAADEIKKSKSMSAQPARNIPKDLGERVAGRITSINEKELDENIASSQVADIIYKNMNSPDMYPHFLNTIEALLKNDDTAKYAATTWTAILWHEDEHPEYRQFIENVLLSTIDGHLRNDRPTYEDDLVEGEFSAYAFLLGESFIQMMRLNSDLYNILTDIYSQIIRTEMERDLKKKRDAADGKKLITGKKKSAEDEDLNPKKLYDDIVDFIASRGQFRSDTLNQKNPNEYIIILADRMRSTRRYVIQDIMNRYALEKKKQLEKELREREASAEDVIMALNPFKHGLYLFWLEKRYNFKYLAVEKVRITLQIFAIFLGLGTVGGGFLEFGPITLFEGALICGMMVGFAKLFCSRYVFNSFYPKDVTVDLEKDVSSYTPTFRKMSFQQILSFMLKQIKEPENALLLHLLPEYVRYVFAVMPDRNEILLTKENLNELMERIEVNLAKTARGR